jgi:ABC-2 type transport system ATP-binding protein
VIEDRIGVQLQIGYMPENAPLYYEMLVQEYLLMMAELRGIPKEKRNAAVVEAAKATGLENWLVRPISTLSKGYRQRVGLCQAILHKPDVLILDEPTNGLDPVQIVEIRGLIRRLSADTTVILSTHILPEIEAVCDRVIILIDGELAKNAPLGDILSSNKVRLTLSNRAEDVGNSLGAIEGIRSINRQGPDPVLKDYDIWTIECREGAMPIPAIVRMATDLNWDIGAVATEIPSLEHVFQNLMDEHIKRRKATPKKGVAA